MPSLRPARLEVLRRRPVQRLVAAGAVVSLASALATIEALAAEADDDAHAVQVTAADEIELVSESPVRAIDSQLAGALDARQVLLDAVSEADAEIARARAEEEAAERARAEQEAAERARAEQEAAEQARAEQEAAERARAEQEAAEQARAEQEAEAQTASEPAPSHDGAVPLATWERLAECESGGNWSINTGNGFYGGLQFELRSWEWVGGSGYPHEASKQEQIRRAEILLQRQGWEAWPACSRQLGLR
jgi:flagellar biosynthesis GTPase FlhF